jgi:chromosome partitioning protein
MARVIAFSIQKGGSGKTTSVVNVGAGLARKGNRVLLIDLDAQANLSQCFGLPEPEKSISDVLVRRDTMPVQTLNNQIDIVPANLSLASIDLQLAAMFQREMLLKKALEQVKDDYDFVLIDCPPTLGILVINALVASDYVLIPMQSQYLATSGFKMLYNTVEMVNENMNEGLSILGVFMTYYDSRKKLNKASRELIKNEFGDLFMETFIRNNISLAEAPVKGKDIFSYKPNSNGAKDYNALVEEVLSRMEK